jgi:small-conductance mechanosensitive channel
MHTLLRDLFDPTTPLGAFTTALICLALAVAAARVVRLWSARMAAHPNLFVDPITAGFVGQLLQVGCFLVAAIVYAHLVPALHKLGTALLAGASVLSLVVGLAAQNTLGHPIAGIAILFYRPFALGDVLSISTPSGVQQGTVLGFTLGYTKLETSDGTWIFIPNSLMLSNMIVHAKRAR